MEDTSIAKSVRECIELFQKLASLPLPPPNASHQMALMAITEEEPRFKIWSRNIGAHSLGRQSLQYRLRDASHLQKQVLALLADLSELLEDAFAIVCGNKVPWDQIEDDEILADESDSLQDSNSDESEFPTTELEQIASNVPDTVNCLLRLSVAIRNPAPHDRFAASVPVDVSYYEPFDIHHVQAKFQKIDNLLAQRLGHAISRRRQYFKYRESHHLKLAHGLDLTDEADGKSTIASSIPGRAKGAGFNKELSAIDEDAVSNSGISQTSFASSLADIERLRIPPPPKGAESGPFECPFCYMIITATNRVSWKRHVFADLRPYICLSEDCTAAEKWFGRRHEWILHEVENHWKFYVCPYSCSESFQSRSKCVEHVHNSHPGATPTYQLEAMINLSSRPIRTGDERPCPICKESLDSVKKYQRHVGRHQEQLAIFALPSTHSQENEHDFGDDESNPSQSDANSESIGTDDGGVHLGELQSDDYRESASVPFSSAVGEIEPVAPEAQPAAPASLTTTTTASDKAFQKAPVNFIPIDGVSPTESSFSFSRRPIFLNERERPHIDRLHIDRLHIDRFGRPRVQIEVVESTPSSRAPDRNHHSSTTSHDVHERNSADYEANTYDEYAVRRRHPSSLRLAEMQREGEEERQRRIRLRIAKAQAEINKRPPVPMPPAPIRASSFKTTAAMFDDDGTSSRSLTPSTVDGEDTIRRLRKEEEERQRHIRLREEEEERQRRIRLRIAKALAETNKRPPVPIPPAPIPLTAEALRRASKSGELPGWRSRQRRSSDSACASNGSVPSGSGGPLRASRDDFTIRVSGQAIVRVPGAKPESDGSSAAIGSQAHEPAHEDQERTPYRHVPYENPPFDLSELYDQATYEHAPYDPSLAASDPNFY